MARYSFGGAIEEFPAVRDDLDQLGITIDAVSTEDGIIHLSAESITPDLASRLRLSEVTEPPAEAPAE